MLFCRAVEVNGQSLNDNRTATTKIMQFDKEKDKQPGKIQKFLWGRDYIVGNEEYRMWI